MYKNTEKHKLHFAQKIQLFLRVTLGPGVILAVCGRILMRFSSFESYLKCKFNELKNKKISLKEFLKKTRKCVQNAVSANELISI